MISDHARKLLLLVDAIAPDGGATVARRFAAVSLPHVHPDAGEIVVEFRGRMRRLPLASQAEGLVARDVLDHVLSRNRALRVDDLTEAERFPQTHALLLRRGLRSMLALPLSTSQELRAVAVFVASSPCAFAGVPTGTTEPLCAMAGLSLRASLRMTALRKQSGARNPVEVAVAQQQTDVAQSADAPSNAVEPAQGHAPIDSSSDALSTDEPLAYETPLRPQRRRRFRLRPHQD